MFSVMSFAFELTVKLVGGAFSLVTGIVCEAIQLSCLLGYVIVGNSVIFFNTILQIITGLARLIIVLIEDYSTFVADVHNTLSSVFNAVRQCAESSYYLVVTCVCFLCSCVSFLGNCLISIVSSVYTVFYHIFISLISLYLLFKKTCLLVGLSVWNTVTGVPDYLLFVVKFWMQKVIEGLTLLLSCIQSGLASISEFPVKPVCGLSIAILLALVVLKKRYSLWHIAYRTWLISTTQCQQLVISGWQSFEGYVLWLLTNQTRDRLRVHFGDRQIDNMDDSSSDDSESSTTSDDNNHNSRVTQKTLRKRKTSQVDENLSEEMDMRLCVVCQDKMRCIVTLPCRHVCLCNTCCTAVRQHQGLCPLCRQEITYAGRVYL